MRTAWLVVLLLMPVAMLNYLDRQMLASMKTSVVRSLPDLTTDAQWGFMLGQFKWVYAFLSPLGGWVADRFSRRAVIAGSLFVWSAVTWTTGHVTTYNELLWARSLMGISEAFYIPAALALITDHHLGPTRSRAVGLHQMGIYVGVILGGFGGYAADSPEIGWRFTFFLCGVVGMIYAGPLFFLLKNAPRSVDETNVKLSPWEAVRTLAGNNSFLLMIFYFTLPGLSAWVVRDWMPAILKDRFDIGQGLAGVSATLYWQLAAIVGVIIGGAWADRRMRRHIRGRIHVSACGTLLIVPAMFGVGNAPSLTVAILFLMLFGLGWGFFDGNNMPILCQIVRPESRATGYGILNLVGISCGGLADWGFGLLNDQGTPLNLSFAGFALFALFAVGLVMLIRPESELSTGDLRR